MANPSQDQAKEISLPVGIRSREELNKAFEKLYGQDVSRMLQKTEAKKLSVDDQKKMVEELKKAGLNGQSEEVLRLYSLHSKELGKKEMINKKWYEKVWDGTKETVKGVANAVVWPFKKAGEIVVKHPFLTAAAVAAFVYFGIPLILQGVGVTEGVGAGVVVQKMISHLKTFLPFSPTLPPMGVPETIPPALLE